jgi:DNA-binding GntR family transcriptional regulator
MSNRRRSGATSVETITRALRAAIVAGDYPPDATLRLSELAARFGVSPIPVREALRALQVEGFAVSTPRDSARVASMTLADLREVYALRRLLEEGAVRLALSRLDAIGLRRLERLSGTADRADQSDLNGFLAADRAFHHLLWQIGGSTRLLELADNLWEHGERYRRLAATGRPQAPADHVQLVETFNAHDPDRAATAIRAHLAEECAAVELGFLAASPAGPSRERIVLFPTTRRRGSAPGPEP